MTATVIHIEGMDLAGKTTARNRLAKQLGGWKVRSNKLCDENPVFDLADKIRRCDGLDGVSLGHLFVAAIGMDLRSYKRDSQPLIQDSTILLRSLAYHRVNKTPGVVEALERLLPDHPRFSVSFVLTASLEARLERLQMRRERSPSELAPDDLLVERDPRRFLEMEHELLGLADCHFNAKVIDTSEMCEAEVSQRIIDFTKLNVLQLASWPRIRKIS